MALTEITSTVGEVIGAKFSSLLSITGSFLMLRDVTRQYKKKSLPMNLKVILIMCVGDLGSSFWGHLLGTWMVPADQILYGTTELAPFAVGTQETCNAQGWLFNFFGLLGFMSNVLLAVCYYLVTVKEVQDSKLQHLKWQALFLGFPLLFGLCISTAGAVTGPAIYDGGWYCEQRIFDNPGWKSFALGWMLLGFITILWCMVHLVWNTYRTESVMDRYQHTTGRTADRTRTVQVSKQGIAYVVVYLFIYIPLVPFWLDAHTGYSYNIFFACLFPLQGFLNCIVYFRPRYGAERRSGKSRIVALTTALNTPDQFRSDLSLRRMSSAMNVLRRKSSVTVQVDTKTTDDGGDSTSKTNQEVEVNQTGEQLT